MSGNVFAIILGGGQGKRLFPLTKYRSKPAVPIGGIYRLVDIPISNSINSDIKLIYVLTQFNSTSLHKHIHRAYPYESFHQTSIELLAAEQTFGNTDWFQGTADAVRKNFQHFHAADTDTVLVLSGDHLYRMDYRKILRFHEESRADVTISTVPVERKQVPQFGIMQIRGNGRIRAFREKPSKHENIKSLEIPNNIRETFHLDNPKEQYLASMGVYAFRYYVLKDLLSGNEADFGKEVIPRAIERYKCFGYVFNGYWRDIGTIRSFYAANLELTRPKPQFSFLDPAGRIFTRPRFLPPSKFISAQLRNAIIGEGTMINGAHVENSVVGLRSVILKGTRVRRSVLMGNDYFDVGRTHVEYPLQIGENCRIENCIIDKNVHIGNRVSISNPRNIKEEDGPYYHIREGIVIIPKNVVIPDGTRI
ncbi:MAG: glucose-1-phosphate adenylyltransferase [Candidatus Omnitrophota bacterium]